MMTHNLYIEYDEYYSNVLYSKLVDRIRDLQD